MASAQGLILYARGEVPESKKGAPQNACPKRFQYETPWYMRTGLASDATCSAHGSPQAQR